MAKSKLVSLTMRQQRLLDWLIDLRSLHYSRLRSNMRHIAVKYDIAYTSLQRVSKEGNNGVNYSRGIGQGRSQYAAKNIEETLIVDAILER